MFFIGGMSLAGALWSFYVWIAAATVMGATKLLTFVLTYTTFVVGECPDYLEFSTQRHAPLSAGKYQLSLQRPSAVCRTFSLPVVENAVTATVGKITDPDLARLFYNTYPNTLDTAIRWKGYAADSPDEELTFVITGDINAMWLRDSSNQLQSYLPLLESSDSPDSLASLYRGVINLQARYLLTSPYCNSFQPPKESNITASVNGAAKHDEVTPGYDAKTVFECKYELDSLAAFLEVSTNYYTATNDISFFGKHKWVAAVQAVMDVARSMMIGTYAEDGSVNKSPYTFTRTTDRNTETLANDGFGNPVQEGTGLIRSAFRPSDDSTIYQLFIPANMMFSHFLSTASEIMAGLGYEQISLANEMKQMAQNIRDAISHYGVINSTNAGQIYAFEIDGFGSQNLMDDANIPSLLSAPFLGYLNNSDPIYQNTRKFILSRSNPYFMQGPVISAIGGPHIGPGYAWPMAAIVRILTSDDESEVYDQLKSIVSSTDGLGLIHESINTHNVSDWTRQWFSWANGLFGQMILDLDDRMPQLLQRSYQ